MEQIVIVVVGPTCSGKTALSLRLASHFKSEIISADSRQVFKYLDIGTAKPSPEELAHVRHHFIDQLEPDEEFNVSRFETDALAIIEVLSLQNKIPIAAGGSGLYIQALVDGIFNSADTDEEYRKELHSMLEESGREYLYEQLKLKDPESAAKMLPQNYKRVIRALEVLHLTGKPIGEHHKDYVRPGNIRFLQYGLNWPREVLYNNIEARVDHMIESGLIEEVKNILSMGYSPALNSLNTVGYKEIISYLNKDITLDKAIELIKRNTRRYAKRQMTWFRRDERIKWFDVQGTRDIDKIAEEIISEIL